MLVTVEDGRITAIEGDPKNPATGGHVCLKGISYARRIVDRTASSRRCAGPRAARFERVSLGRRRSTDIAERLDRGATRRTGPESALYYEASGSHGALGRLAMAFWHQFGGCTLTYGDLCWPAGLEATRLTYGANLHNHPRLTADSRFILLWGHNPAETNIHQMRLILDAQERGAPRRGDRSAQHRHDRRGRRAPAAAARHRRGAGARHRPAHRRRRSARPRVPRRARDGRRALSSQRLREYPARARRRRSPASTPTPSATWPSTTPRRSPRCSSPASAFSATTTRARRCGPWRCCRR